MPPVSVSQKIRTGLVELRTKSGSVYVSPSLWERVCLLWTFRNFRSLPRQVLNHREQHLIDRLCRTGIVRRAPITRASVIGAVENVEPVPESQVEAVRAGKVVRISASAVDAVAPRAVGLEAISIPSNRAVRERKADWDFRKRRNNVQSIKESKPNSGEERAREEVRWTISSVNRLRAWGRWALVAAFGLTLAWISLHHRKNRPVVPGVVAQSGINVSLPSFGSTSASSASAPARVAQAEKIQHTVTVDRTQAAAAVGTGSRDAEERKSSPTKTVISPQTSAANNESLAGDRPQAERLRIEEAPTSFDYPIAPNPTLTGNVSLKAVIGRDGTVTEVDVLSGKPALAKAAMRSVKHWRYRVHEIDGKSVEAETNIEVNFHGDEVVSVSYPGAQ
jgi:outer membrane biosynthesis protein TonB